MKIGLISGRSIPKFLKNPEEVIIETAFGEVNAKIASVGDHEVFFIQRHGAQGNLPPHKVNYRGNIQALFASHVDYIISVGTVGSLNPQMMPGYVVIPHDFIDGTKNRVYSYFDAQRVHVDMSESFCPQVRASLIEQAKAMNGLTVHEKGVYLVTEGPRLETPAEIKMFQSVADIVGMTLVPEISLARERGLCYASFCLVCNRAAGLQKRLPADEIAQVFTEKEPLISKVLENVIIHFENIGRCCCQLDVTKASL